MHIYAPVTLNSVIVWKSLMPCIGDFLPCHTILKDSNVLTLQSLQGTPLMDPDYKQPCILLFSILHFYWTYFFLKLHLCFNCLSHWSFTGCVLFKSSPALWQLLNRCMKKDPPDHPNLIVVSSSSIQDPYTKDYLAFNGWGTIFINFMHWERPALHGGVRVCLWRRLGFPRVPLLRTCSSACCSSPPLLSPSSLSPVSSHFSALYVQLCSACSTLSTTFCQQKPIIYFDY